MTQDRPLEPDDARPPRLRRPSPELTRDARGVRVWLPLHLHGVAAFRAALDERLDLAVYAYDELSADSNLSVLRRPELTTVAFQCACPGAQ